MTKKLGEQEERTLKEMEPNKEYSCRALKGKPVANAVTTVVTPTSTPASNSTPDNATQPTIEPTITGTNVRTNESYKSLNTTTPNKKTKQLLS